MVYALAFDVVVAVLLAVTIVYAVILNRKLSALRDAKAEMERILIGFAEATGKAERGLATFRDAADGVGRELQRQIETGRALADDLTFLVQRGGALADRLGDCRPADRPADRPGDRPLGRVGERVAGRAARTGEPTAGAGPAKPLPALAGRAEPSATPRHKAAGLATAALGSDGDGERAISPKQAALLKALKAIR